MTGPGQRSGPAGDRAAHESLADDATTVRPRTDGDHGDARSTGRVDWQTVLGVAAGHVRAELDAYGEPPTLRRLHYLLVSDPTTRAAGYVNTQTAYKLLSDRTARARDAGTFPALTDQTRTVERAAGWSSPAAVLHAVADDYRVDRAALMPVTVVVLVEKAGVVPLVRSRFDWLDVSAVRGYASVSHADTLARLDWRPARDVVGLYLGDYDPTGLDIDRALAERLPYPLRRVGLTRAQVEEHGLPPAPAKAADARLARMVAAEGAAMQVELDALPAPILLALIADAVEDVSGVRLRDDGYPDWPDVDESEAVDRARLLALAAGWSS